MTLPLLTENTETDPATAAPEESVVASSATNKNLPDESIARATGLTIPAIPNGFIGTGAPEDVRVPSELIL